MSVRAALDRAASGALTLDDAELLMGATGDDLDLLLHAASAVRDAGLERAGRPGVITYSKKVFLPITTLCRDRCHYCIFVDTPGKLERKQKPVFMSPEQILSVATQGAALGCKEALFTLGDRPEERWPEARAWLDEHGYASTMEYLRAMAAMVTEETGLLVHMNPGVMSLAEMELLRPVAPSMGMMLETTSERLWSEPGQVHFGSPDKEPRVRLQVLEDAGTAHVPLTTGILVGIGETLRDRAESLFAIRASSQRHGQIQEVIVQNFRAKDATAMQGAEDLGTLEYVAAIATARLVMGADARIQVPPNLADPAELDLLVRAGIDDWGGVSPLTADHVNPERPWPQITELARQTAASGYELRERLTAHPPYIAHADTWIDPALHERVRALTDASLLADATKKPSGRGASTLVLVGASTVRGALRTAAREPLSLTDEQLASLLTARGAELDELTAIASDLRRYTVGESVSIVVNRNLSPGDDPAATAAAAWTEGATELCVQGVASLEVARAVKTGAPGIHLHAMRPFDIVAGADELGLDLETYFDAMKAAGVDSVPGTGVKPGDVAQRPGIDLPAAEWERVIRAAHHAGFRSSSVVFYGLGERVRDLVDHLRMLRRIQEAASEARVGGFTEVVPMPAPDLDIDAHRAMTAVTRIALHGAIPHVQVAWPRLSPEAIRAVLQSGADDLGGTLGGEQTMSLEQAARITRHVSRTLRERTTLYGTPSSRHRAGAA